MAEEISSAELESGIGRQILETDPDAVVVLDPDQRIVRLNPAAEALFGYAESKLIGSPLDPLLPPDVVEAHGGYMRQFAQGGGGVRHMGHRGRVRARNRDGTEIPTEATIGIHWQGDRPYFFAILRDVSDQVAYERAQRIDPNTQLGNEVALYEALNENLQNSPHPGDNVGVALLRAIDLNDLINTIGVEGGDRVLAELAHSVEQLVPEVSATYRTGDSSLAFLLDTHQSLASERIGPAIQDAASAPIHIDQAPMRVEPAIGLAPGNSPSDPESAGELLRRGRVALHQAELLDRSWVSYDPVFDVDHSQAFELMGHVKRGLADGEFELHYQPKVSLDNATQSGVEALIRWRRSDGEVISPAAYMPKLERTSLIDDVSQFVIQTAIEFAGSSPSVPVSINLAPRNLADKALIQSVIAACQASGLEEGAFEVEVTETGLMREPEQAMAMLEELREHGIGVSIDDFGTGYSSFAYLRRLPATNLKIDHEFVRDLEADPRSRSLVFAMIQSGHGLGMTVTAEGVETPGQRQILTDYGCNLGQGFLWTPALPPAELDQWYEQTRDGQTVTDR